MKKNEYTENGVYTIILNHSKGDNIFQESGRVNLDGLSKEEIKKQKSLCVENCYDRIAIKINNQ